MNYYLAEIRVIGAVNSIYQLVKADDEKEALKKVRKHFKKTEYHLWIHKTLE